MLKYVGSKYNTQKSREFQKLSYLRVCWNNFGQDYHVDIQVDSSIFQLHFQICIWH